MKRAGMNLGVLAAVTCLLLPSACHHRHRDDPTHLEEHRPVTLEVEVYDPQTNFVWEGVGVRLVQAKHEWSGCLCANPNRDDWYYTDDFGTVLFSPKRIAAADIGFKVDGSGQAIISGHPAEDEAIVLVEVWAENFKPVLREVRLTFHQNDVFVSIPFE